mmetsp:Transcript_115378/g.230048  ORF Transcript_115378/g.230048 Transcript_115378/m.230048 type:complete len:200 (+) Transcript_115378:1515-2114(+)
MSLQQLMPSAPATAEHPSVDTPVVLLASDIGLPRLATEQVYQKHDTLPTLEVHKADQLASPTAMWICHVVAVPMAAGCTSRLAGIFEVLRKQLLQVVTQCVLSELNPAWSAASHAMPVVVRHLVLPLAARESTPLTWVEETMVHQVARQVSQHVSSMLKLSASLIPLKLVETDGIDRPLKACWPGGLLDQWETTSLVSE